MYVCAICVCFVVFIVISSNQFALIKSELSQLIIMAKKDSFKKAFTVQGEELKNQTQDG